MKPIYFILILLSGCAAEKQALNDAMENIQMIQDPIERGLSWIALSILVSAIIRAFANE